MEEVVKTTGNASNESGMPPIPIPRKRIKKVNHSIPDPLVKDFVFVITDQKTGIQWAFRVYEERSRRRKWIQRLGVVVDVDDTPEIEVPENPDIAEEPGKDKENVQEKDTGATDG